MEKKEMQEFFKYYLPLDWQHQSSFLWLVETETQNSCFWHSWWTNPLNFLVKFLFIFIQVFLICLCNLIFFSLLLS